MTSSEEVRASTSGGVSSARATGVFSPHTSASSSKKERNMSENFLFE
jgi:hypothetical protein